PGALQLVDAAQPLQPGVVQQLLLRHLAGHASPAALCDPEIAVDGVAGEIDAPVFSGHVRHGRKSTFGRRSGSRAPCHAAGARLPAARRSPGAPGASAPGRGRAAPAGAGAARGSLAGRGWKAFASAPRSAAPAMMKPDRIVSAFRPSPGTWRAIPMPAPISAV